MKLVLFAPELVLLLGGLALFLASAVKGCARSAKKLALGVSLATLVVSCLCLTEQGTLFYDAYKIDLFSQLAKLVIAAGFAAVMFFGGDLKDVADEIKPEYFVFLTMSVLGLFMLVSSADLLSMFIALELSSYSLYLLVPMRNDRDGLRIQMEAAIKYILFGAVATGVMLFGMSYLFGLTGTTYFTALVPALRNLANNPAVTVGLIMVLAGFFFKLAAFPMHFWAPDVYQGSANETSAFVSSVPKVAAVVLLVRVAVLASPQDEAIIWVFATLAACSMLYGNLVALVQTDVKRMLGFSGIAHAGYVLLGLVTLGAAGYAAALYYITGYLFMNVAAFLVICAVSKNGENLTVSDLGGLYKRSPLLAFTLGVSMFALAGMPPFVGFMGKFFLLTGAYKAGHVLLVIFAAINTAISIYYYLSVVRSAYSDAPQADEALTVDKTTRFAAVVLVLVTLALGLLPNSIIDLATNAVRTLL